jgi:pimeloyl-ACP methyl ester carboxylesterase
MQTRTIETNGTSIHVRVGGHGPAVVMLHGFGTTGDMWGHLASALIEDHMIVAPDLRGLGLSPKPDGGYDKKNQAADVVGVLGALGVRTAELVTHDIGIMVGFAVAATHPERVSRWVGIDAPLPGVVPWDRITQDPAMWHFGFGGSDMERLVAGRERIYLDRFWNELSRDPKRFDEAKRQHYAALYAQPGAMRAGFAQFLAFGQDAADNKNVPGAGQASDASLGLGWRSYIRPYDRRRDAVCCRQCRRCDHSGLRALDHGGAAASDDEARRRLPTSSSLTGGPCLRGGLPSRLTEHGDD